jgi:hypothetical protein
VDDTIDERPVWDPSCWALKASLLNVRRSRSWSRRLLTQYRSLKSLERRRAVGIGWRALRERIPTLSGAALTTRN